jgi:hypothetical protein
MEVPSGDQAKMLKQGMMSALCVCVCRVCVCVSFTPVRACVCPGAREGGGNRRWS